MTFGLPSFLGLTSRAWLYAGISAAIIGGFIWIRADARDEGRAEIIERATEANDEFNREAMEADRHVRSQPPINYDVDRLRNGPLYLLSPELPGQGTCGGPEHLSDCRPADPRSKISAHHDADKHRRPHGGAGAVGY